jgi:hypothetical protein
VSLGQCYEKAEEERAFMRVVNTGMADLEAGREVSQSLDEASAGQKLEGC